MVDIIDAPGLAVELDDASVATSPRATKIVDRVNRLITEVWANPVDPVPAAVEELAYTVAGRAWFATRGRGVLDSITSQFDDSQKTVRYKGTVTNPTGAAVYLTDEERAMLGGYVRPKYGSIRLSVPRTW